MCASTTTVNSIAQNSSDNVILQTANIALMMSFCGEAIQLLMKTKKNNLHMQKWTLTCTICICVSHTCLSENEKWSHHSTSDSR